MKKTILLFCMATAVVACKPEAPKDYVTISGNITHPNEDLTLEIRKGRDFLKTITIKEDGSFSDTLKIPEEGKYYLIHNKENGAIYLQNGNTTSFTLDTEEFDESLKFEGDNASKSNFYVATTLLKEEMLDESAYESSESFNTQFSEYKKGYDKLKAEYKLDEEFSAKQDSALEKMKESNLSYILEKENLIKELSSKPSPTFEGYENYAGGTSSLSDFKGKYVYVDVWATWCGPCKAEIPSLKKVEEEYQGKNIEFVSISVDAMKDKEAWKSMIAEKEMGGVQLFADKSWTSDFVTNYKINGIPRFILIDPSGNIVTPDAPRPSDPKLIELFTENNI